MKDSVATDGAASAATDQDKLNIATLAKMAQTLEWQIEAKEVEILELRRRLREIVADRLPAAMMAVNMEAFRLADGSSLEIKRIIRASISEDNRDSAFSWLRENNFGDIIKNQMTVLLDRGQDNVAGEIADLIHVKYGLDVDRKETVHPSTLSKFVREQMERGRNLPDDLLGIYSGREAVIKTPKKGK